MPISLRRATEPPAPIRVALSAPSELEFSLFVCGKLARHEAGYAPPEWARALDELQPDLARERETFWADIPLPDWSELLQLAWRTGTLTESDLGAFFAGLDEAASRPIEPDIFPSEPADYRRAVALRLETLREDHERRLRYRNLLERQWEAIRPEWESVGRSQANAKASEYERAITGGADLRTLLPSHHLARMEQWAPLVAAGLARGEVVIAPAYFAGEGQMLQEFPGLLLLGAGLNMEQRSVRRRETAESTASRLKAVADPTRLALLITLLSYEYSVTDLTEQTGASQAGVSAHMKTLRDAGLLESRREGNRTVYRADPVRVAGLLDQARDAILAEARPRRTEPGTG